MRFNSLLGGKALKEVAHVLDLRPKTVEFHKRRVMNTFNLKNNADLVLFALGKCLIGADL
jgi:DNA-binding CsgD family transcriptional regulator